MSGNQIPTNDSKSHQFDNQQLLDSGETIARVEVKEEIVSENEDGLNYNTPKLSLPDNDQNYNGEDGQTESVTTEQQSDIDPECAAATTEDSEDCVQRTRLSMKELLPQKIAATTILSKDGLSDMLLSTLEKKLEFLPSCGEFHVTELELSFPEAYADNLTSDKLLMENIILKMCQATTTVGDLCLPQLNIETLHYLVEKKRVFKCIKCTNVNLPIFAESEENINQFLPEIIKVLVDLEPKDIKCTEKTPQNATNVNKELKNKLGNILKGRDISFAFRNYKKKGGPGSRGTKDPNKKKVSQSQVSRKKRSLEDSSLNANKRKRAKKIDLRNLPPLPSGGSFTFDSIEPQQEANAEQIFTVYQYWQLESIHESTTTGRGTTVAIVDTGIDPSHPAFDDKNITFKDFSPQPGTFYHTEADHHGTLCAGIACGKKFHYPNHGQSPTFPSGVAPDADLVICKVIRRGQTDASKDSLIAALRWINSEESPPVDVVSLSLGSLQFIPEIAQAITELVYNNIIVVCAASNLGNKFSQPIAFPARLGHVLCIGSHGPHGKPSPFSPVGQQIDFLAPGEKIAGPSNFLFNHHWIVDNGTSYAAPAVAGLICLILSLIKQQCNPNHVEFFKKQWVMKEILREVSTSPGRHTDDQGFGGLNPQRFFQNPDHVLSSVLSELTENRGFL